MNGVRALAITVVVSSLGLVACERASEDGAQTQTQTQTLDLGAVRASAVDGLEAASRDPAVAARLGLAARCSDSALEPATARLFARVATDPELSRASDELFERLQDGAATRAALVDYARENPELDLAALSLGFVGYVDQRLTRPELATRLEQGLRAQLRGADVALAVALIAEAGGASTIAAGVVARLEDPGFAAALGRRLGRDPLALQGRLERRLADPARAGQLLEGLQPTLASGDASTMLAEIIDHERTSTLLAEALTRALGDEQTRARCEQLYALALAQPFDGVEFDRGLEALLAEPSVAREAAAWLSAIAREPAARAGVAELIEQGFVGQAGFDERLLEALD